MNKVQQLELLNKIVNSLHNAMDEVDDIKDNELPKSAAMHYMMNIEMALNGLIDEIDSEIMIEGHRSGAV